MVDCQDSEHHVNISKSDNTIASEMVASHPPGETYSVIVEGNRKGIMQLSRTAIGFFELDLKELGEDWAQPWYDQLVRLNLDEGTLNSIPILAAHGLASGGKITRKRFDEYVSRLKLMSPEMVQRWLAAINYIGIGANGYAIVGLMVGHSPLFTGSDSIEVREQRELNRLQSIPASVIIDWSKKPRVHTNLIMVSLHPLTGELGQLSILH